MENDRGVEETWTDWDSDSRGTQVGLFIGLAIGAGVLLFILRRLFAPKPKAMDVAAEDLAERAAALLGNQPLIAGRDLLGERALPEMKPILRALLKEIEASVSQGFKRAERAIDDL